MPPEGEKKKRAKRENFKVHHGIHHITVYQWGHPYSGPVWRFAWRVSKSDKWQYVTRTKKERIIEEAKRRLQAMDAGEIVLLNLPEKRKRWLEDIHRHVPPADEEKVNTFIRTLRAKHDVSGAVSAFLADPKLSSARGGPAITTYRNVLSGLRSRFKGKHLEDISSRTLIAWWRKSNSDVSSKSKADAYTILGNFWSWAQKNSYCPPDNETATRLQEKAP